MAEIKNSLHSENTRCFGDSVEVNMQHIQSGLSRIGNLTAFMKQPEQQKQQEAKAEVKTEAN